MKIDWQSTESHFLQNPKINSKLKLSSFPDLKGHIWLRSSGTTAEPKYIALSKQAFLTSAQSVNGHIGVTADDRWLCVLPRFHVGGLAIFARAFLTDSKVFTLETAWSAQSFANEISRNNISICSVVPTQLYDLVRQQLKPHSSLQVLFVGGGTADPNTLIKAIELGWPVVPTYGMTEACSQVATASPDNLNLNLLPHIEAQTNNNNQLLLKSESLFTGVAIEKDGKLFYEPRDPDSYFKTQDLCQLKGKQLSFLGRTDDLFKINGELVNQSRLQKIWHELRGNSGSEVFLSPHPRRQFQVALVTEDTFGSLIGDIDNFNSQVAPFEKINACYRVGQIPRTTLGKFQKIKLLEHLKLFN